MSLGASSRFSAATDAAEEAARDQRETEESLRADLVHTERERGIRCRAGGRNVALFPRLVLGCIGADLSK